MKLPFMPEATDLDQEKVHMMPRNSCLIILEAKAKGLIKES